jgi:hypothetical protein
MGRGANGAHGNDHHSMQAGPRGGKREGREKVQVGTTNGGGGGQAPQHGRGNDHRGRTLYP